MNLVDLDTFVRVAEAGSLTKAGLVLNLPKSTISRRVARLEQELGIALLLRKGRTIRLTEQGELLRSRCLSALNELAMVEELLHEDGDVVSGPLSLKIPPVFSGLLSFATLLSDFQQLYPDIQLHVEVTSRQVDLIEEGIDIALRLYRGNLPSTASLMTRRLMDVRAGLFASPTYLKDHGHPKTLEELSHHTFVLPKNPQRMDALPFFNIASGAQEQITLCPSVTSNEIRLLQSMLVTDVGIGLLPDFLAKDDLEQARLERVLPDWAIVRGAVALVWPTSRYMSARVRAFLDFMVEHVVKLSS